MEKMKSENKKIPAHETFRVAALLALVGGFLDAYTYILRGGVFANAQTGNMVLLAVNFAEKNWTKASYYLIPIFAFAAGVFMTNLLKQLFSNLGFLMFKRVILLVETVLLFLIGFLPTEVPDGIVNVTVSFICSMQVNTFRKVHDVPYASTMCTGNLRSGTEKLFLGIWNHDRTPLISAVHYFGIIGIFILGAVIGTILSDVFGVKCVWVCCVMLLVSFGIIHCSAGTIWRAK